MKTFNLNKNVNKVQFLATQQLNDNFYYCQVGKLNQANLNIKQEVLRVRAKNKFEELEKLLKQDDIKVINNILLLLTREYGPKMHLYHGIPFYNNACLKFISENTISQNVLFLL